MHEGIRGRGICLRGITEERGRQARERIGEAGSTLKGGTKGGTDELERTQTRDREEELEERPV